MIHVVVLFVVIICAQSLNWWLYFSPCISVNSSAIFLIFCLWSPWVESDVSSLASFHFGLFSPDFTNFLLQQNVIVSPLSNCLYIEFKFGACSSNACYFHACYLTGKASHEGTFSLKELINLNTAGDENTSVMSCHSDVLVSIFLSSGIMQTKYLWFHLYWSQAYFDGDTCVIKGNSSYCKVL